MKHSSSNLSSHILFHMATAYGSLVAMDPYIYAPNGMGMAACAVQLSLFGIYGFPKVSSTYSKKEADFDVAFT